MGKIDSDIIESDNSELMIFHRPFVRPIATTLAKIVRIAYGDYWVDFRDGHVIVTSDKTGERVYPLPDAPNTQVLPGA